MCADVLEVFMKNIKKTLISVLTYYLLLPYFGVMESGQNHYSDVTPTEYLARVLAGVNSGTSTADLHSQELGRNKVQLKELRAYHHTACCMHIMGARNKEIAQKLGMTEPWVSSMLRSDVSQHMLTKLRGIMAANATDVAGQLKDSAPAIMEKMISSFFTTTEPKEIRLMGLGLIDRAGYAPVRTNINLGGMVTQQDLDEITALAAANGIDVVDDTEEAVFEDITKEGT